MHTCINKWAACWKLYLLMSTHSFNWWVPLTVCQMISYLTSRCFAKWVLFFSPALFESSTPHLPEDKSGCKIDRPSTDRARLGIRQRFPSHLAIHRVWDGELIDSWQAFPTTGFSQFKSLFICCLFSICPDTHCLLRIIWKCTAPCELCKFTTYMTC